MDDVTGWSLDDSAKAGIDRILRETTTDTEALNSWRRRRVASQPDPDEIVCRELKRIAAQRFS
jgi:hypothetical protein